nr:zinc finger protein 236-like [Solea senegalensis]
MRCGQNLPLPMGGHSGGTYPQSLHCDRPTPDLHLQDGPHQDTRSSSVFHRTLPGASHGLNCGSATTARSSLPYLIKQENSMGYKTPSTGSGVHSSSQARYQICRTGEGLGAPRDVTVVGPHVSNNGSSICTAGGVGSAVLSDAVQPFNNEDGSSPLALSPTGSHHSARLPSANSLKRRCLSLASQSIAAAGTGSVAATSSPSASGAASEDINITAITCSSSQMSMVACVNGLRTNLSPSHASSAGFSSSSSSSSTSPPSNSCSQEAQQRPQAHGSPQQTTGQESCQLSSPASCLLSLSCCSTSSSSVSSVEPEQGQGQSQGPCEEQGSMLQGCGARGTAGGGVGGSDGLGMLMSGALMSGSLTSGPEAGVLLDGGQKSGAVLKQEPLDDFSPSEDELFQQHYHHHLSGRSGHLRHPHHPPRSAMPPPYHLHQYVGPSPGGLLHSLSQQTASASSLGHKQTSGCSSGSIVPEQEEAVGGTLGERQVCRWIDCSAAYEQQEELVRHIEKVHIDQRKGEDFTCFWAGCIRRYKPFNARYKLLIHMRVHSGEKPNKCMSYSRQESQQDIVLGADMPISSIQATIAKLSIRPPSTTDPAMEATGGLDEQQETVTAIVSDLDTLGDIQLFQEPSPPADTRPPSSFSPPLSSPPHSPPPPNGLDVAACPSSPPPTNHQLVPEAAPSVSPPPASSSLQLLASLTPEAFSMEGGGRGKQRVTKQSFLQPAEGQGLHGTREEEGGDPLSSLDPLWSLNKR